MIITGGTTNYGAEIGIIMLDTIFPRIVGDIGNAGTFSFPVRYKTVHRAFPTKVVLENDAALLSGFIAAARELEAEGVRALTTSCGFLAVYQQELAAAVSIPVFASSLLQVPLVERMIAPNRKVVIVTAHKGKLSSRHLLGTGITGEPPVIVGMEEKPEFYQTFVMQKTTMDLDKVREEVEETACKIKENYREAGAIVLECTNLPPFRSIFQQVTGLPVFDITTLVNYIHHSLNWTRQVDTGRMHV
ncbi:MAG: aspartate/glutamate racemase family protein [Veillonellales bacterium]